MSMMLVAVTDFDVHSPEEHVELRWSSAELTRKAYREFWDKDSQQGVCR